MAVPENLDDPSLEKASGRIELPLHVRWSGPPLSYDLDDRADRARVGARDRPADPPRTRHACSQALERTAAEADRGRRAAERHRVARPALIAYFDTSALVKLLVPERGAADVAEAWLAADRRVSTLLLYAEARAALAWAQRMGRLTPRQLDAGRRRIDVLWAAIVRLEVTDALVRRAGDLSDRHGLRAYHAVHLAALERTGAEAVLVSADEELLRSAQAIGFTTIRPSS